MLRPDSDAIDHLPSDQPRWEGTTVESESGLVSGIQGRFL
jgi:hypothetical protein